VPGDPPPALRDLDAERTYQALLDRSARTAAVYDLLDTRAFFAAVWQTPTFAEARVRREGAFREWPPELLETRLAGEHTRLAGVTEFFLGIHVNEPRLDDLGRATSIWRLAVEVDGGPQSEPTSIERIGRSNPELRASYPFMESFWVGYRVRFPELKTRPGQKLTLHLASVVGAAHLVFPVE
jgi:hypothetical protein